MHLCSPSVDVISYELTHGTDAQDQSTTPGIDAKIDGATVISFYLSLSLVFTIGYLLLAFEDK